MNNFKYTKQYIALELASAQQTLICDERKKGIFGEIP